MHIICFWWMICWVRWREKERDSAFEYLCSWNQFQIWPSKKNVNSLSIIYLSIYALLIVLHSALFGLLFYIAIIWKRQLTTGETMMMMMTSITITVLHYQDKGSFQVWSPIFSHTHKLMPCCWCCWLLLQNSPALAISVTAYACVLILCGRGDPIYSPPNKCQLCSCLSWLNTTH